jgi:ABC-type branched-subunit amino acid transport system ATPase component
LLESTVKALVQQAHHELARRDDQWSPLAGELALWCDAAAQARHGAQQVAPLKAARKWLTDATVELREQRLAPLAEASRSIWADLRQESNVDLGAFRLTGTNTRRQLDLDVTIDGEPGSALGVMSQGEINALALSIFLPRATIDASPFRFLLIDDPVQAMDPAKVDGLAKVLGKVAQQRQVIVFTHDNRLVSAVKDLAIAATIMEVTRKPRSDVEVRECQDAGQQALSDARALTKDANVPTQVAEQVVPGLCRTAAEAAFIDAYWRAELRRGRTRAQIEETLNAPGKNLKMRRVATLALFDGTENGNVPSRLSSWGSRWSAAYQALNPGVHQGHSGDLTYLVDETKAFVAEITRRLQ